MTYTITRDGKTFEEYNDYLRDKSLEIKKSGERASWLSKKLVLNEEWFNERQEIENDKAKRKIRKDKLETIKDITLAIEFSGISQKNPALVEKQILDGDETLLSSLESVKDQVNQKVEKEILKEAEKRDSRESILQWLDSVDFSTWKSADTKKLVIYLAKEMLSE